MKSSSKTVERSSEQYLLEDMQGSICIQPTDSARSIMADGCLFHVLYDDRGTDVQVNTSVLKQTSLSEREVNYVLAASYDKPYAALQETVEKRNDMYTEIEAGLRQCTELYVQATLENPKKISEANALAQGMYLLHWLQSK